MSQQPYAVPAGSQPPPPRDHRNLTAVVIGLVIGFGALGMFVCCGGILGIAYLGVNVIGASVEEQIAYSPEMVEHVGEIESFTPNFIRSMADNDDDTWYYDVVGAKGKALVTVNHSTDENGDEVVHWATLTLGDGTKIDLTIE